VLEHAECPRGCVSVLLLCDKHRVVLPLDLCLKVMMDLQHESAEGKHPRLRFRVSRTPWRDVVVGVQLPLLGTDPGLGAAKVA